MTTKTILSAGEEVKSGCLKCKGLTNHTIVAMNGDSVAKVQCNVCKARHNYRPEMPVKAKKKTGPAVPRVTAVARKASENYGKMMDGRDEADALPYSMSTLFGRGDLVKHPTFGLGLVTQTILPNKIELTFNEGARIFICQLPPPVKVASRDADKAKKRKKARKSLSPMM